MVVYHMIMTTALDEALDILQEECAELIVIASKVKRFGAQSENPEQPGVSAQQRLVQEMADVQVLIRWVCDLMNIDPQDLVQAQQSKQHKLNQYTRHLRNTP